MNLSDITSESFLRRLEDIYQNDVKAIRKRMVPVTSKAQMFRMLCTGCFGNTLRMWFSPQGLLKAVDEGYDGLLGVRCIGVPGLPYYHHMKPLEAIVIGESLQRKYGIPVCYYEASQDQYIILQGEFMELPDGRLYLWYTTVRDHMRAALAKDSKHVTGYEARYILQSNMSSSSWEDMLVLLECYPGHVVEFTAYEIPVGILSGRTVCIWECRNY